MASASAPHTASSPSGTAASATVASTTREITCKDDYFCSGSSRFAAPWLGFIDARQFRAFLTDPTGCLSSESRDSEDAKEGGDEDDGIECRVHGVDEKTVLYCVHDARTGRERFRVEMPRLPFIDAFVDKICADHKGAYDDPTDSVDIKKMWNAWMSTRRDEYKSRATSDSDGGDGVGEEKDKGIEFARPIVNGGGGGGGGGDDGRVDEDAERGYESDVKTDAERQGREPIRAFDIGHRLRLSQDVWQRIITGEQSARPVYRRPK